LFANVLAVAGAGTFAGALTTALTGTTACRAVRPIVRAGASIFWSKFKKRERGVLSLVAR
jgi:hypothetical protein